MIWRLGDLPELQHLGKSERRRLLRTILPRTFYLRLAVMTVARSLGILLVFYLAFLAFDGLYYSITGNKLLPRNANTNIVLMLVLGGVVLLLPAMYLGTIRQIRRQVRDALRDAEQTGAALPVCPDCAYGLEGVLADACPECGRPLRRHASL